MASLRSEAINFDPSFQMDVEAGETYYAAISGWKNLEFDPRKTGTAKSGDTGRYQISWSLNSTSERDDWTNERIANTGVFDVHLNSGLYGELGYDDNFLVGDKDVDLYRFRSTASDIVGFRTSNVNNGDVDTFLRLFDEQGLELSFNDDVSTNRTTSYLQVQVSPNTDYYIMLVGTIRASSLRPHFRSE